MFIFIQKVVAMRKEIRIVIKTYLVLLFLPWFAILRHLAMPSYFYRHIEQFWQVGRLHCTDTFKDTSYFWVTWLLYRLMDQMSIFYLINHALKGNIGQCKCYSTNQHMQFKLRINDVILNWQERTSIMKSYGSY